MLVVPYRRATNMRVVTPEEMRDLEARFMSEKNISSDELMGHAAYGLMLAAIDMFGRSDRGLKDDALKDTHAIICCGPGANGGDGWALAWRLYSMQCNVIMLYAALPKEGTAAHNNYLYCKKKCPKMGMIDLNECGYSKCEDGNELIKLLPDDVIYSTRRPLLCVDAMFGTGLDRPLTGAYLGMMRMLSALRDISKPILAADIPSGLSGLTGENMGACPADVTVTMQFIKRGLLLRSGQDISGKIICKDIGIPESYAPADAPIYVLPRDVHLNKRLHDSHKGTYGHLLIAAGSCDYAGAALMAVGAALRAGAGLVTAACVRAIQPLLQLSSPAAMAMCVTDGEVLGEDCLDKFGSALSGKNALVIGPGLTRRASPALIASALGSGLPAVVDADALNIISENSALRALLTPHHVLTPHPGEMARLLGHPCADPVADAKSLASELNCIVLLKGCTTCISDGTSVYMMNPGAPGMACGGSGDVLSGVIGALLAQGISPINAAIYGAMLHGRAGVLAEERLGAYSMNAKDIIDELPHAFMEAVEK